MWPDDWNIGSRYHQQCKTLSPSRSDGSSGRTRMSSSDCMLSTSSDAARIWLVITRTVKSSQALKSLAGSDIMLVQ